MNADADATGLRLLMSGETIRRRTEIWVEDERAQWRRTDKLRPWSAEDARVELVHLASRASHVVTPRISGPTLIYDVPRPFPLAYGMTSADPADVANAIAASLSGLHEQVAGSSLPTASVARVLTAITVQQTLPITEAVVEQIEQAARSFSTLDSAHLLHGDLGLASVVESSTGFQLIAGDDLAWGPREMDIGWLFGDLVEHARLRSVSPAEAPAIDALGQSFLRAYARIGLPALRPNLVIDFVVCRLLHHALDAEALAEGGATAILELLPAAAAWVADLQYSTRMAGHGS